MAAGVVSINGYTVPVGDASCGALKAALPLHSDGTYWDVRSCSSDPVVAGTVVSAFNASGDPYSMVVASTTATAGQSSADAGGAVQCSAACTVTIVHQFALPVLQLSPTEGASVAGAILLAWALGYSFRMIVRTLRVDEVRGEAHADD